MSLMSTEEKNHSRLLFEISTLTWFLFSFCIAMIFNLNAVSDSEYDQKRFVQFSIFLVLCLDLIFRQDVRKELSAAWAIMPLPAQTTVILVIILGAISSFFCPFPKHAFQEWSSICCLLFLTLYLSTRLSSSATQKIVLAALGVIFFLYAWRCLAGTYVPSWTLLGAVGGPDQFIGISNRRFLNQLQSWTIPLLAVLPIFFSPIIVIRHRWVLWLPGILSWLLLFASDGRGVLLGSIAGAAVVLSLHGRTCLTWIKVYLSMALAGFALYQTLFFWIPRIFDAGTSSLSVSERLVDGTLSNREGLWRLAWQFAQDNPILGIGPHQFARLEIGAIATHPHSAPLQWMSEWGMVSFALVAMLMIWGAIEWVRFSKTSQMNLPAEQSVIIFAITASLIAGSVHSLVSGIIVMPFSQLMMALVIGWALGLFHASKTPLIAEQRAAKSQRYLPTFLVVFLTGILIATSYPEILMVDERTKQFFEKHPQQGTLHPRFWNQGLNGW